MKSFSLEFERDFGLTGRTGWTISVDGHCIVMLERWLIVAVIKTVWYLPVLRSAQRAWDRK